RHGPACAACRDRDRRARRHWTAGISPALFRALPWADHGRRIVLAFRRCGLDLSVRAHLPAGEGVMSRRLPPLELLLAWLALLALLGLTVFGAYQPLGAVNTVLALTIAVIKALIVAAIFMELRRGSALTIAFAAAGFFWLGILLWLAFADFSTRV